MRLSVKPFFFLFFLAAVTQVTYAQHKRAPYNAVVFTDGKEKVFGKITAITDSTITLVNKKDVATNVSYGRINRIKVYKYRSDIGYGLITGGLAVGAIAVAQSIDDGNVATIVGIGGTAAVVGLGMALHNVIHGPEVKMKASKEKIDYNSVSTKLSKYVVNDISLKP